MSILLTELIAAVPHAVHGDPENRVISAVEYNSKLADSETLFFCLPGARLDGHDFAPGAYSLGCRAFVVERVLPLPSDAVQIVVTSARESLAYLSAAFYGYPARDLTIIGITGTKGKTTTSILIQEILLSRGIRCGYIGSNGVIIGEQHYDTINSTPESRELHRYFAIMREKGYTHLVMEVSSQALDHCRVLGIPFDTVLYTNLAPDHISESEHATFDEYRDAKRKLFTDYGAANVIYNGDDVNANYMIQDATGKKIRFAIDSEADFRGAAIRPYRAATSLGIDFDVTTGGECTDVRLRTPGRFSAYNGLAAIAACSCYGIPPRQAADALKHISIRGRFEIVDAIDDITFIIDYAHNGLSLTHALTELRAYEPRRLICIFGCIGGRTYGRRRELAEAATELADYTIITSDNPDNEEPEDIIRDVLNYVKRGSLYTAIADREEAVRHAVRIASPGDIVLFAGKGHENYQLVHGKKVPFSEKKLILDEAEKVLTGLPVS